MMEFEAFAKIPRAKADAILITEKLDGTNAQIAIGEDGFFGVGSRNRWITPDADNFGFAAWAYERRDDLIADLGPGRHYGEWWGAGIQRRYDLDEKRLSLFNTWRPAETLPSYVSQVPVIYHGPNVPGAIDEAMAALRISGSVAAPGFMRPEGVVIYSHLTRRLIKRTFEADGHKWQLDARNP